MPYIERHLRERIQSQDGMDLLAQLAHAISGDDFKMGKALGAQSIISRWMAAAYGPHLQLSHPLPPLEATSAADALCQQISARLSAMASEKLGADALLDYTITRFLDLLYPGERYKDLYEIAGLLEGLKLRLPVTASNALGMLCCCSMEYYRTRATPIQTQREGLHGPIALPEARPTES